MPTKIFVRGQKLSHFRPTSFLPIKGTINLGNVTFVETFVGAWQKMKALDGYLGVFDVYLSWVSFALFSSSNFSFDALSVFLC